jgi:small subunit ribosomal protein S20
LPHFRIDEDPSLVARKARTWKGARTPQALKRVRQSLRRRAINQRTRSEAKTLVLQASNIALGRSQGDGATAVTAAISALDKAAEKGIIHPNNAARRKSRLMAKANAAHLLEGAEGAAASTPRKKSTATRTVQRKKVAAAKASKAAAAKSADRPRTAAGKAKVAVVRASRETAAARRKRAKVGGDEPEAPAEA